MGSGIDMRTQRLALGLAQRAVAERAAVRETDLRKWERGLAMPDRASAKRLASVLGIDAAALLRAQKKHASVATPGEGYVTSEAGTGDVVARAVAPPANARRVLDLFCGAGGLSLGFEQSGEFVTTCGVDLLRDRVATFATNHRHASGVSGDLRERSIDDLARIAGDVDVVVGGPPCQGFSSIRPFRNLTEGDPRNSLAEHYVLVINRLRPAWFVFENVVGILTHEKGARLAGILERMRASGYVVDWRVMNAALYGVPQLRERVVLVGNRVGATFAWPEPTHRVREQRSMAGARAEVIRASDDAKLPDAPTLMDAIDDLPALGAGQTRDRYEHEARTAYQREMRRGARTLTLHEATRHSPRMLEIIRHAGANLSALPPGLVKSGFSSCYSRLDADRPSTTLTVNFVHPASNRCIHPHQDRALTPREGARIQSFPDRFEFRGGSAQIVKQIGNAVPPLLGQRIAEAILRSEDASSRRT